MMIKNYMIIWLKFCNLIRYNLYMEANLNTKDFEQKKNEKVQLMRDTFKEKGKLEAMMVMQDQLDYVG